MLKSRITNWGNYGTLTVLNFCAKTLTEPTFRGSSTDLAGMEAENQVHGQADLTSRPQLPGPMSLSWVDISGVLEFIIGRGH